jgi:cytidyltransferase-like protein
MSGQTKQQLGRATTVTRAQTRPRHKFKVVAMGGTFDALHRGHRKLLKEASEVGREVVIGVTSDVFVRRLHKPHKVDSYNTRKRDLERILSRWKLLPRTKIVPLDDRFGPAITSSRIQALVVSKRTMKAGHEINRIRRAKGLTPLTIVPIDLILAEDRRPISSTRIRRGRIDREGRLI